MRSGRRTRSAQVWNIACATVSELLRTNTLHRCRQATPQAAALRF